MDDEELDAALSTTTTQAERTRGLLELLPREALARATRSSTSTLRNWAVGQTQPRPDAAIILDDLRHTAHILLRGGIDRERVTSWFMSRDTERFEGMRPIEMVPIDPMDVVAGAKGLLLSQMAVDDEDRPRSERERGLAVVGGRED